MTLLGKIAILCAGIVIWGLVVAFLGTLLEIFPTVGLWVGALALIGLLANAQRIWG